VQLDLTISTVFHESMILVKVGPNGEEVMLFDKYSEKNRSPLNRKGMYYDEWWFR